MHLDRLLGDQQSAVRAARLAGGRDQRLVARGGAFESARRAVDRGPHHLRRHIEFHSAVLQRLERADRLAELLALPQIVERHVERALRQAEHFRRRRDPRLVERGVENSLALAGRCDAEKVRRLDILQMNTMAGRAVGEIARFELHALVAGLHGKQADALGRARRHDQDVRLRRAMHVVLDACQPPAIRCGNCACLAIARMQCAGDFLPRDRDHAPAFDQARHQIVVVRSLAARERAHREHADGRQRLGPDSTTGLREQRRAFLDAETHSAAALRRAQTDPSELDHLVPARGIIAFRLVTPGAHVARHIGTVHVVSSAVAQHAH